MPLFGGQEADRPVQGGRRGGTFGLLQDGIHALLLSLSAPFPELVLKVANRLAEMECLGSLSKRGGRLLFEEVLEVPELFNTRFREGGLCDLWSWAVEPDAECNILPGPLKMHIQVVTGVLPRPARMKFEAALGNMAVFLRELRALSQRGIDRCEGPFLWPRGVSRKKSAVRPRHGSSQRKMAIASCGDEWNMLKWPGSFGDSIRLMAGRERNRFWS